MKVNLYYFVGVAGFEPATPCSQSRYTNRTVLYPVSKLRVQKYTFKFKIQIIRSKKYNYFH